MADVPDCRTPGTHALHAASLRGCDELNLLSWRKLERRPWQLGEGLSLQSHTLHHLAGNHNERRRQLPSSRGLAAQAAAPRCVECQRQRRR
ncbi:TOL protein [Colletotrichum scovillei]|uniref:TOL protein n=1 Tax=Colletotrichum scovillei TaxID=1209932 RepID=A0A9P7U7F8_9PEZI|nr:TOL protein [Colletotrichum scovillei]KAG7040434.1 TOL protein [Colletotrichum scovillei]KAG7060482.1 TOL protein [Colletotrichum scovillei]